MRTRLKGCVSHLSDGHIHLQYSCSLTALTHQRSHRAAQCFAPSPWRHLQSPLPHPPKCTSVAVRRYLQKASSPRTSSSLITPTPRHRKAGKHRRSLPQMWPLAAGQLWARPGRLGRAALAHTWCTTLRSPRGRARQCMLSSDTQRSRSSPLNSARASRYVSSHLHQFKYVIYFWRDYEDDVRLYSLSLLVSSFHPVFADISLTPSAPSPPFSPATSSEGTSCALSAGFLGNPTASPPVLARARTATPRAWWKA